MRQQDRSDATRAKLVRAARKAFAKRGYAETSTPELAAAVDAFRESRGMWTGIPRGYVDGEFVRLLWTALEEQGIADDIREQFLTATLVRR